MELIFKLTMPNDAGLTAPLREIATRLAEYVGVPASDAPVVASEVESAWRAARGRAIAIAFGTADRELRVEVAADGRAVGEIIRLLP